MGPMNDLLNRLKARNADVQSRDDDLRDELEEKRGTEGVAPDFELRDLGDDVNLGDLAQETIVMRTGRPVLAILRNQAELTFTYPDSMVWKSRLENAASALVNGARAVGRIEVEGHNLAWLGTGWLVAPDVVVTNRHVAAEFGRQDGARFVFRQGLTGQPMTASIDFLEEVGSPEELTFALERVLHIEGPAGPDMAFLRVAANGSGWPSPIALAASAANDELVAVIGYPARDSRIPDQQLMEQIFGDVYDKKRLAPGQLTRVQNQTISHDCSTLGGNSGSVVMSLRSGEALGLHFAGRFLEANFAVSSSMVGERLGQVLNGRRPQKITPPTTPDSPSHLVQVRPVDNRSADDRPAPVRFTSVIPLRVTLEVGTPYVDSGAGSSAQSSAVDSDEMIVEGVVADYADRSGYDAEFLGLSLDIPLPDVTNAADVLTFSTNGPPERVLRYEHFSVVMSKSRRMCRYSAVNVDGKQRAKVERTQWRTDPRIPKDAQISKECYGSAPKFSRGHMTRREDPVWGAPPVASRANDDSMHVTNAVPQMQTFNAGVWLDLENYALFHARQDEMKISVFTGPFLTADDPVMFGVQIPVEFWKVIAFIHDDTGQLSATGYTISQSGFISEDEFVFGEHKTAQCTIASIEQRAGLSFGDLSRHDPFVEPEGIEPELTDVRQIQFV
jgi:endonuclease G, mitochondrial